MRNGQDKPLPGPSDLLKGALDMDPDQAGIAMRMTWVDGSGIGRPSSRIP
jgi:hypothetical protein